MRILIALVATVVGATAALTAHAAPESARAPAASGGDAEDERLRGEPIEGADSTTDAPLLEPGRYTDTVRGEGTDRFYAIEVPEDGGLLVTATGHPEHVPGGARNEYLAIELFTADGTSCGQVEHDLRADSVSTLLSTGVIHSPHLADDLEPACLSASRLLIRIFNRGDAEPYPIEITAWTFPEVLDADTLPGLAGDEEVYDQLQRATASGDVTPVSGGRSLSDAPVLEPGVYRDAIRPGEQRVYRVRADWGQTPRFTATLGADTNAASVLGNSSIRVRARWASPLRHIVDAQANPDHDVDGDVRYGGGRPAAITAAIPQIRFLNQGADTASIGSASFPGSYSFIVEADAREGASGLEIPFQLQVDVEGDVSGAPEFDGALLGPSDELPEAADDDSGAGFPWLATSLIVLGVVLLLTAAILLAATRSGRRLSPTAGGPPP